MLNSIDWDIIKPKIIQLFKICVSIGIWFKAHGVNVVLYTKIRSNEIMIVFCCFDQIW